MNDPVMAGLSFALVVLLLAGFVSFNRLIGARTLVKESWSDVDTELRRRHELIPSLVASVSGYAAHERATLEEVSRLRSEAVHAGGVTPERAQAETALASAARRLFAVAEANPDLKASSVFLDLARELANTEDRLQAARRFYNANVRDYNRRVQSFPSRLVAVLAGFREERFFQAETAERAVPQVVVP